MLQPSTRVSITDNSGPKIAKILKILPGLNQTPGAIGSRVIVSITKSNILQRTKRKIKQVGVVVRTSAKISRKDGNQLQFNKNSIVVISRKKQNRNMPKASRIKGPIALETQHSKILQISSHVL